ncbi:MAG: TIGR04100 family radical SAM protein [Acutalibacteraceae bacterium]|nr:TIGR04100 family radical SAM protein [Acutalibacteraceae bacterium]
MTITYPVKKGIYINMTNRCPCACTFCLRQNGDSVYGSDPLWLEREPTIEEVCADIDKWDLKNYEEIVFCGYGEPTERLEDLLEVAKYIKSKSDIKIRINTNGLCDLIHGEKTAHKLKGLIDTVSISLNATNKEDYLKTVRPKFGIDSYEAMLNFTKDCTNYVPNVIMTVVDVVTSPEEQELCRKICESVGATLRIRPYED